MQEKKEKWLIIPEKIQRVYYSQMKSATNPNGSIRCKICKMYLGSDAKYTKLRHSEFCAMKRINQEISSENKDVVLNLYALKFLTYREGQRKNFSELTSLSEKKDKSSKEYYYRIKKSCNPKVAHAFCTHCGFAIYKIHSPENLPNEVTNEMFVRLNPQQVSSHRKNCQIDASNYAIEQEIQRPDESYEFFTIPFLLKHDDRIQAPFHFELKPINCEYTNNNNESYLKFMERLFKFQKFNLKEAVSARFNKDFDFNNFRTSIEKSVSVFFNYVSSQFQNFKVLSSVDIAPTDNFRFFCGVSFDYSEKSKEYSKKFSIMNQLRFAGAGETLKPCQEILELKLNDSDNTKKEEETEGDSKLEISEFRPGDLFSFGDNNQWSEIKIEEDTDLDPKDITFHPTEEEVEDINQLPEYLKGEKGDESLRREQEKLKRIWHGTKRDRSLNEGDIFILRKREREDPANGRCVIKG